LVSKRLTKYLGHHILIRCAILNATLPTVRCKPLSPFLIVQQLRALFGTLFRAAPKNRFFILTVEFGVLGSALGAQNAAQIRYFKGTLRGQVAISLGKQSQTHFGALYGHGIVLFSFQSRTPPRRP
jgi:hypothetical protein